jgi:hypothetical protein
MEAPLLLLWLFQPLKELIFQRKGRFVLSIWPDVEGPVFLIGYLFKEKKTPLLFSCLISGQAGHPRVTKTLKKRFPRCVCVPYKGLQVKI